MILTIPRDWKKLTFYYFADAYINFNSLVTDLFKVYKTRIWMSAINPASFASPSLGLQPPNGVGPGAVGVNRHQSSRQQQQQQPESYNVARGYPVDRGGPSPMSFQQPLNYGYNSFAGPARNGGAAYGMGQIDPFAAFAPDYGMQSNYMTQPGHGQEPEYARQGSPNNQWMGAFQSLSLGGR